MIARTQPGFNVHLQRIIKEGQRGTILTTVHRVLELSMHKMPPLFWRWAMSTSFVVHIDVGIEVSGPSDWITLYIFEGMNGAHRRHFERERTRGCTRRNPRSWYKLAHFFLNPTCDVRIIKTTTIATPSLLSFELDSTISLSLGRPDTFVYDVNIRVPLRLKKIDE